MAQRPRIGVTGSARRWAPAWWCTRLAVYLAGGKARRISVNHTPADEDFAAIVIGGGNDIAPEHYGGDIHAKVKSDPARDRLEMHWIEYALEHNLPLLGICRGAQLINVVHGGSLHQDIRGFRHRTSNRPGLLPTKQVRLNADSCLSEVCGGFVVRVNSLHHQAVKDPGVGLQVVARDRDNIVQGIESTDARPIIGVQWHPEYLCYLPGQLALFRWLLRGQK